MNPSKEILNAKLDEIEILSGVSEHDIDSELKKIHDSTFQETPCQEWIYESMAFTFCENYPNTDSGWGTYFGPMAVWPTADGKVMENPSIHQITDETLAYWKRRSRETDNPLLIARYAGLVWDLTQKAVKKKPHYSFAIKRCEAIIRIAKEKTHKHGVDVIHKLEHAMLIATSLGNTPLIDNLKNAILKYESAIAEDDKPGLWGFSFDSLIGNKKVILSEKEEKGIIDDLESRLKRIDGDPWSCEHAAERLGRYYRTKNKDDDCFRVIKILGHNFETAAKNSAPIVASSLLQHIHEIYSQYNLTSEVNRVSRTMQEIGPKMRESMQKSTHHFEIPIKEFNNYIDEMIDGNQDAVFSKIMIQYIPKRDEIENQLKELSKNNPISFLFTKQISDHEGRVVATIGSLENDLDGNIVSQMSQNMSISAVFLDEVLNRTIAKFNLDNLKIVGYLYKSPAFSLNQKGFLLLGLEQYINGNFVDSAHLLIPQIETSLRNLVKFNGGYVLRPNRIGGFFLRTLDDILRSEQLIGIFGENITLYFRVVLTDQRGWNIRNNVCHGMTQYEQFTKDMLDRLIHILIVLSQVKEKET